jgi:hypothetical protein
MTNQGALSVRTICWLTRAVNGYQEGVGQVIVWDRGRPARKRAAGAQSFRSGSQFFSRFALICGRDARGRRQSLDRFLSANFLTRVQSRSFLSITSRATIST